MAAREQTILLVEDEPDVLQSIVDVLQASIPRARVLHAASAEDGLRYLHSGQGSGGIDVVVSDYRLPGMNGLSFLAEARRRQPQAPRLLITAYAELEVAEAAVAAAHVEAVVMKPLDVEAFVAHIQAALRKGAMGVEKATGVAAAPGSPSASRPPTPMAGRYVRDV